MLVVHPVTQVDSNFFFPLKSLIMSKHKNTNGSLIPITRHNIGGKERDLWNGHKRSRSSGWAWVSGWMMEIQRLLQFGLRDYKLV